MLRYYMPTEKKNTADDVLSDDTMPQELLRILSRFPVTLGVLHVAHVPQ
jgi:hypothetical protein